jgi:hypothetical protein
MKKLQPNGDDGNGNSMYMCPKCQKTYTYGQAQIRYLFQAEINDRVTVKWVTFYDEGGKKLFGMEAREVRDIVVRGENQSNNNNNNGGQGGEITKLISKTLNNIPYLMRLRVKEERYNGQDGTEQQIIKASVSDMEPLFKRENTRAEPIPVVEEKNPQEGAAAAAASPAQAVPKQTQQHLSQGRNTAAGGFVLGIYQRQAMLDEIETMKNIIAKWGGEVPQQQQLY